MVTVFTWIIGAGIVAVVLFFLRLHHEMTYMCTATHPKHGTRCKLKPYHAKNAFVQHTDRYGRRWR